MGGNPHITIKVNKMGRYGLHNGNIKCKNLTMTGDLSVTGNFTFGNASTDALTVNGAATFNANTSFVMTSTNVVALTHSAMTENLKPLSVSAEVTDLTHGARQGGLFISVNRAATAPLSSWDGNGDCGLKIQAYNRAANTTARGGVRGMDIVARSRDSGTLSWLNAAYLTAELSDGTADSATVAQAIMKNNGVISTAFYGLVVQDTSQGTSPADTVLLKLTTGSIAPASGARNKVIQITDADSTGFTNGISIGASHLTNVLDFSANDGSNGAKDGAACATTSTSDGAVKIDVNGTPYYVPYYTAAHTVGAW